MWSEEQAIAERHPMQTSTSSEHTESVKASDSRRDLRLSCDRTMVQASLEGREEPVAGHVVEVSKSGVKLLLTEPASVGAGIRIPLGDLVVQGVVRHCKQDQDDTTWAVGVLVD